MAVLRISGDVNNPTSVTLERFRELPAEFQIPDVGTLDPKRQGEAVTLAGLIALAQLREGVQYLTLHSARDNFHASIPLEPIAARAVLIYQLHGAPLAEKSGGPFRFYIPEHHTCRTDEIDECANVKFVDHMEFTARAVSITVRTMKRSMHNCTPSKHRERHRAMKREACIWVVASGIMF